MTVTATATATATATYCVCGCGRTTKSLFAPGHDAQLAGKAARVAAAVELGQPAFETLPAWLEGRNTAQMFSQIASRVSPALAEKFRVAAGNAKARLSRPRKAAKVAIVVVPTCEVCNAGTGESCRAKDGRRMARPHKNRAADSI